MELKKYVCYAVDATEGFFDQIGKETHHEAVNATEAFRARWGVLPSEASGETLGLEDPADIAAAGDDYASPVKVEVLETDERVSDFITVKATQYQQNRHDAGWDDIGSISEYRVTPKDAYPPRERPRPKALSQ